MPNPSPLAWILSLVVVALLTAGVYVAGIVSPAELSCARFLSGADDKAEA